MKVLKPLQNFFDNLLFYGLEHYGRFYGAYRGQVESNDDPKNIGRLKISCYPLYGTTKPQYWAFPRGSMAGAGHGVFWIPQPGDPVYISCEGGDPRFPLWEYGWWLPDNVPAGAKPKVYVFLTPTGQRVELNDDANYIDIKHKDGFHVKLFADGMYLGKDDKNLGKFLDDLLQLLVSTTTPTIYGASPFNNVADYAELKTKILEFLKLS